MEVWQSLVYHVSEKQRNLNTFQILNFQAAQGLEFHKGTIFQMLLKMEQQDWYPFSNMAHYKESSSTICQKKYEMKAFFKHKKYAFTLSTTLKIYLIFRGCLRCNNMTNIFLSKKEKK